MDGVYFLAILIVLCNLWMYHSLKKRVDALGGGDFKLPPVNIYCTPQGAGPAQAAMAPQVTVSPAPASSDEMAAVVMAAIAAYESESEGGYVQPVAYAPGLVSSAPASVHESEKFKRQHRDKRWAATARHESHKRL